LDNKVPASSGGTRANRTETVHMETTERLKGSSERWQGKTASLKALYKYPGVQ